MHTLIDRQQMLLVDYTAWLRKYKPLPNCLAPNMNIIGDNQSINQSKHISIAPYVASESEAHDDGN